MSDESDLQQSFTAAILDDFAERTDSDASIVLDPLGDGMGWRATVVTSGGLEISRAANVSVFAAIEKAVERGHQRIKEALEDDDAEDRS